jgi:hypothetical protein
MDNSVLIAVTVVMHISAYIRQNHDVDHRTAVLPSKWPLMHSWTSMTMGVRETRFTR